MEKLKKFISYCSNELELLCYSLIFSLCFIIYGRIFDLYNISSLHRFWIILLVSFSVTSCSQMIFVLKRILKK